MKHYFILAVIQGALSGYGLFALCGCAGVIPLSIVIGLWCIKSACDIYKDDHVNPKVLVEPPLGGDNQQPIVGIPNSHKEED